MGLFKRQKKGADDETATQMSSASKKGLFSKLRKEKKPKEEVPQAAPASFQEDALDAPFVEGVGDESDDDDDAPLEVRDEAEEAKKAEILEQHENYVKERATHFKASDVRTNDNKFHTAVAGNRPSARDSVMKGGMRYDWIDIETVAALKLQAAYRGQKCREDLIKRNITTAAMRNKMRERNAKHHVDPDKIASEDVPFFARFCGIGLLFGNADEGLTDFEQERRLKEKEKNERKRRELEREEMLRSNYRKQRAMNAKETVEIQG